MNLEDIENLEYKKTNWEDWPSKKTKVTAQLLMKRRLSFKKCTMELIASIDYFRLYYIINYKVACQCLLVQEKYNHSLFLTK